MVLDPVSALSVAAVVVQFVDFGTKLVSKSRQLYKSVDGRLVEHNNIRGAADTLTSQCEALRKCVNVGSYPRDPVPGEEGMHDIVRRCLIAAEKLQRVLDELRVNGAKKVFESFRKAIKTLWKKEEVDEMLTSLNTIRAELTMSLLIVIRNENAVDVQELKKTNKEIEGNILSAIQKLAADNQQQIDDLRRAANATRYLLAHRPTQIRATKEWLDDNQILVASFNDSVYHSTQASSDQRIRAKICNSLGFDEMSQRYDEIPDAQARTFAWVFDAEGLPGQKWPNFGKWLQDNGTNAPGLYWVSGKPGSGKSTLMRYLCKNEQTRHHLEKWSGSSEILVASCFFWNPGTRLQKSQQGLLRTLLFQLLTTVSDFPSFVFPRRWQLFEFGTDVEHAWSNQELQHAILTFVEHYAKTFSIVLFVDGLDEYEGSDEERLTMCDMLHQLAQNEAVKVCTSSRPWNVYQDAFRQDPMLRLEDLTREDIQNFVVDKLEKNQLYQDWSRSRDEQSYNFRTAIVEKAQGVFLWVRLVIGSLLTGLRNRDDVFDLERRLEEIPADLDAYFNRIIGTLDGFYLKEASLMFEVALSGCYPLMTYYYLHDSSTQKLNAGKVQTHTFEDISELQEVEDRRINARCMGLLESSQQSSSDELYPNRALLYVDFLHRTAKDYIQSPAVHAKILSWHSSPVDISRSIFLSNLCQLKSVDLKIPWMSRSKCVKLLSTTAKAAQGVFEEDQTNTGEYLKEIETLFNQLRRYRLADDLEDSDAAFYKWRTRQDDLHTDFLAFSIDHDLDSYILQTLKDTTASQINSKPGVPYLVHATFGLTAGSELDSDLRPVLVWHPAAAKLLLIRGADPNHVWGNSTPWGLLLERLLVDNFTEERQGMKEGSLESSMFEITKAFIEHGAVDTVRVGEGRNYSGKRYTKYVRTLDPWQTIRRCFTPRYATELVKLLDNGAHGQWKARATRMAARLG